MIGLGLLYSAPWQFFVPATMVVAMMAWAVARNPLSGTDLDVETLQFFHNGTRTTVRLTEINYLTVHRNTDEPDTVRLVIKSGKIIHVPSLCADSQLASALQRLGIPKQ